jgi:hypothetical protein
LVCRALWPKQNEWTATERFCKSQKKTIIRGHTRRFVLILYRDAKNTKKIFGDFILAQKAIYFILAKKAKKKID